MVSLHPNKHFACDGHETHSEESPQGSCVAGRYGGEDGCTLRNEPEGVAEERSAHSMCLSVRSLHRHFDAPGQSSRDGHESSLVAVHVQVFPHAPRVLHARVRVKVVPQGQLPF